MTAYFSVKGFEKHQHYKDRNPPWIKLYNDVLDDYEFGALPDASKAHLVAIWLLASRYKNRIPLDAKWIERRINANESVDLNVLASAGFIIVEQGCSETLADRKQDACLETETETETEKISSNAPRVDASPSRKKKASRKKAREYDGEFLAWWDRYPKREAKGDAFDAYWAMRDGGHSAEALLAGADWAADKYADTEERFIPLPATFLRGERFLAAAEGADGRGPPVPPKGLTTDQLIDWWSDYGKRDGSPARSDH